MWGILPRGLVHAETHDFGVDDEGAVLLLFDRDENDPKPILGTVGPLQFDVVQYRLKSEYGVAAIFERMPYNYARWVEESETHKLSPEEVVRRGSIACVYDVGGAPSCSSTPSG